MSFRTHYDFFFAKFAVAFCPPPPGARKSQRASENGRSMCTQYSPNLLFNYSHASFAPVLSETPESLGAFYVVCC